LTVNQNGAATSDLACRCPVYPQKRTLELNREMSALCQKQTSRIGSREGEVAKPFTEADALLRDVYSSLKSGNAGSIKHRVRRARGYRDSTHQQLAGDLASHCHDLIFVKPGPHQIGDEQLQPVRRTRIAGLTEISP
jgi:hypothetical protein